MKIWILLLIAGVLLAWAMCRERFDASSTPGPSLPSCPGGGTLAFGMGGSEVCIPPGTDMFDVPADGWEASIRLPPGTDQAVRDKVACKRDGYTQMPLMQTGRPPLAKCVANTQTTPATGGTAMPGPPPGGAGTTSGTTTGGSSTTSAGPNSGGGGNRRKQIFGPMFTGVGEGGNVQGGSEDSSKTNQYPELMGGGAVRSSTRIDGVGIVDPSKNSDTTGLPTPGGLGSNEDSKFLPTSRVPGDMEKIPDPWRVSQSFSASNYSFKTDPVPFLTNFSAFQK